MTFMCLGFCTKLLLVNQSVDLRTLQNYNNQKGYGAISHKQEICAKEKFFQEVVQLGMKLSYICQQILLQVSTSRQGKISCTYNLYSCQQFLQEWSLEFYLVGFYLRGFSPIVIKSLYQTYFLLHLFQMVILLYFNRFCI